MRHKRDAVISFLVTQSVKEWYETEAASHDMTVSDWIRYSLDGRLGQLSGKDKGSSSSKTAPGPAINRSVSSGWREGITPPMGLMPEQVEGQRLRAYNLSRIENGAAPIKRAEWEAAGKPDWDDEEE